MKKPTLAFGVLYLFTGLAYMAYLFGKAWLIPITHDEAVTTILFRRNTFAKLLTYDYGGISANNHILNTIFAKSWTDLVGLSAITLRTGNLLAAIFYLIIGYLVLTRLFKNNVIRIAGVILWLANPYLAEFLALARGYGMTTILEAGAICFGAFYLITESNVLRKRLYLASACVLAILAVWANFATLNFFICFMGLLAVDLWRKPGKPWLEAGMLVTATALLGWMIYWPLRKIKAAGDFRFFGTQGFLKDTVQTFIDCFTLGRNYFGENTVVILQSLIILIFTTSLLVALWRWWKNKGQMDITVWLLVLFPFTIITNLLITKITGSSFLNTRTTLFFYPLIVCATLQLLQLAYTRSKWLTGLLILPLVFALSINFIKSASWTDTYEWRYDRNTYTILDYVEQMYHCEGRTEPYDLHVHCLFHPSFQFHTWLSDSHYNHYIKEVKEIDCAVEPPIDTTVDFYYVQREYLDHFPPAYQVVLETPDQKSVLLRKK